MGSVLCFDNVSSLLSVHIKIFVQKGLNVLNCSKYMFIRCVDVVLL